MLRSATALGAFVECPHLAWLDHQAALGRLARPGGADAASQLLWAKGRAHERAWLERLRAGDAEVVEIAGGATAPERAAAATLEAMRRGAPYIYQGVFAEDGWIGIPDFLERVERPTPAFGGFGYEIADTKLARRTKPTFLLQLCLYGEQLGRAQGVPPERLHVLLGTGERESFRAADFAAYFRRLRGRYLATTADDAPPGEPLPVPFCALCDWAARCEDAWERGDHLCRVADIRRTQIARLTAAGLATLGALATAPDDAPRVPRMARATFVTLRRQARLQSAQAADGRPRHELLPLAAGRGLALLPPPSPGDVFFDMEGDPWFEGGLEYLFGATTQEEGGPRFHAWWAHDRDAERRAFEGFIDFVVERRRAFPDLHVHHYASYEPTALKRLAGRFGSREDALDDLLRGGVLVDLFRVVKQGIAISQPGYSIKKLEVFYRREKRAGGVVDAAQSIVAYERWLETQDARLLEQIRAYNEDDCRSTLELRDWLLGLKAAIPPAEFARAEEEGRAAQEAREASRGERKARTPAEQAEREAAIAAREALVTDLVTRGTAAGGEPALALLGHLLEYHRREERPRWWSFFARCDMTPEELLDDMEAIAGLEPDPAVPPRAEKRSVAHTLRFPAQESKLGPGPVADPSTREPAGEILSIDVAAGSLVLKRPPKLAGVALPPALIPCGDPYRTTDQRDAIRRVAEDVREHGLAAARPRFAAARRVLRGDPPRVRGVAAGAPLVAREDDEIDAGEALDVVARLDGSHLVVQGPPGSGKTRMGAEVLVGLLAAGRRVGVTATSHRVIHHLLEGVEREAARRGVRFRGFKKASADNEESFFRSAVSPGRIESGEKPPAGTSWTDYDLVAGTAWLLCRPEHEGTLDTLFVDEAGQVSLADAVALSTCARNVVFLGDPQQLPHVSQGTHPEGAGASVLEHLLGDHGTVPRDRGLFLGRSWRMHPEVCAFVSEIAYEQRLHAAPGLERQAILVPGALEGSGLRFRPLLHAGNGPRSEEEAEWIAEQVAGLLGGPFVDHEGRRRCLTPSDILVVTPYNAQVRCLRERLPAGVAAGTVDKFQGQEAPVVFYSMATSSGEEIPRHLEFLFSPNRLNVAISRARALAVLVASPGLLDVGARNAAQMRMVNALCRFAEMATAI